MRYKISPIVLIYHVFSDTLYLMYFETLSGQRINQPVSRDERMTAIMAENIAALLNPYSFSGLDNLPDSPPYIIAANHEVLRGDYTNMPYDGIILNHWLRKTKGISPYWAIQLSSISALDRLGKFSRYSDPAVRIGLKVLYGNSTQAVYISPDKCKHPLQELVSKLQQGEVVGIFPTGSKYSEKVKAGILYLSQKAGGENLAVPIVPIRIHPKQKGILRSRYMLEVKPPISPSFATDRLSRDEIREYTSQLQQDLYGIEEIFV